MSRVIGIDPSLTSTGFALRDKQDRLKSYALGDNVLRGMPRIVMLRNAVSRHLDREQPELVVYEGYALGFRGKTNTIFDLGELGGVLKLLILEKGIDILLAPPNNLKLFATGKGNADKGQVALAVENELNVKYSTSDQYDATGLLWMGEAYLQLSSKKSALADYRVRALTGCTLLKGF